MANEHNEQLKRWTAKRCVALVVHMLRGDTSVARAARNHALTVAKIEAWKHRFLSGAENALRSRPLDDEAQPNRDIKRLKQNVGEFVMDVDSVKEAVNGHPSLRQMLNA